MKIFLLTLSLLGLLALTVAFAIYIWIELGDVPISVNGLIAMGVGAFVSVALGAGLMWLVFKSSRDGFDQ